MEALDKFLPIKTPFWAIIGPLSILLTIAMQFFKPDANHLWIPYLGITGLILCYQWKNRGLIASLLLLSAALLARFNVIPHADLGWELGLSAALTLSLIITALGYEEALSPWKSLHQELKNKQIELDGLLQQLTEAKSNHQQQLDILEKAQEKLKEEAANLNAEILLLQKGKNSAESTVDQLKQSLDEVKKGTESREAANQLLQTRHAMLSVELNKSATEIDLLKGQLADLKQKHAKPVEIVQTENYLNEYKRFEGLYLQLREQFEAKGQALDDTRRELFHLQEKWEQKDRLEAENEIYQRSRNEKEMEDYIIRLEKQTREHIESLQQEIQDLQDIITSLSCQQRAG